jgi:hypothetical protein
MESFEKSSVRLRSSGSGVCTFLDVRRFLDERSAPAPLYQDSEEES